MESPEGHQQRFLVERPAGALAGLKFMLCSWRRNSVMPSAESEGLRQKVFVRRSSCGLIVGGVFVIYDSLTTDLGEDERNSDGF